MYLVLSCRHKCALIRIPRNADLYLLSWSGLENNQHCLVMKQSYRSSLQSRRVQMDKAVLGFCCVVSSFWVSSCVAVGRYDRKHPSLTADTSGGKVCVRVLCYGVSRPLQQQVALIRQQVCGFQIVPSMPAVNSCSRTNIVTQVFVHPPSSRVAGPDWLPRLLMQTSSCCPLGNTCHYSQIELQGGELVTCL